MTTEQIIQKYLNFSGSRSYKDFADFYKEILAAKLKVSSKSKDFIFLTYIENKIVRGLSLCLQYGGTIYAMVDEESKEDIELILKEAGYLSGRLIDPPAVSGVKGHRQTKTKSRPKKGLGKVVDDGDVPKRGNSDLYWRRKGIDLVFKPNDPHVRRGETIPESYQFYDMRFIETYYGLKAFEFGNWLSQQDRINYLSGLGLALFDLHRAIGFSPKQVSIKGKLAVSFGARGRGKALAHFEPGAFVINLTRYGRPASMEKRPKGYSRVELILLDGGVGAFAHEYGHALDYFGALFVDRGDTWSLSGDDSLHVKPDLSLMKKKTLRGLMEKLMFKIIWKDHQHLSPYYERLKKAATSDYYIQRNEIFARSFEVYVQYKLLKKKFKNVFLNKSKYNEKFYLSLAEMKKLEPDYDQLIRALKKSL